MAILIEHHIALWDVLAAATLYQRHVMPTLTDDPREIARQTLPSASGAHASLSFLEKTDRWLVLWRGSS